MSAEHKFNSYANSISVLVSFIEYGSPVTVNGILAWDGIHYQKSEWHQWLEHNFRRFSDRTDNFAGAAEIMCHITKGMKYATETEPDIIFVPTNSFSVITETRAEGIILNRAYPFLACLHDKNQIQTFIQRGETVYIGTVPHFAELMGVEESHHFEFMQHSDTPYNSSHLSSLVEHDAIQPEFEALQCQLQYAIENNFPKATIDCIRERINNAFRYRQKHK